MSATFTLSVQKANAPFEHEVQWVSESDRSTW